MPFLSEAFLAGLPEPRASHSIMTIAVNFPVLGNE
jgi:hypothetical protein